MMDWSAVVDQNMYFNIPLAALAFGLIQLLVIAVDKEKKIREGAEEALWWLW